MAHKRILAMNKHIESVQRKPQNHVGNRRCVSEKLEIRVCLVKKAGRILNVKLTGHLGFDSSYIFF